jgi:O-antigen/teichoic acid export membrane protein
VYVYQLNGLRAFRKQAVALASLNVFKMLATLAFLLLGYGLGGVVSGWIASAVLFFAVSQRLARGISGNREIATRKLFHLGGLFFVAYLAVAAWGQIDLIMLEVLGDDPDDVGLFTAASTLAWAPASLFSPLLLVQFPSVSLAAGSGAPGEIRRSLERSLSLSFMILCPLVAGAQVGGRELLALLYGPRFVEAGFVLGPLAVGVLFFTMYEIMDTYTRAMGRGFASAAITCTMLALHFASNWILIPRYQLLGVAISVAVMSVLACILAGAYLARAVQPRLPWASFGRTLALSVLAFVPYLLWSPRGMQGIAALLTCLALYFGLLLRFEATAAAEMRRIGERTTAQWRALLRSG